MLAGEKCGREREKTSINMTILFYLELCVCSLVPLLLYIIICECLNTERRVIKKSEKNVWISSFFSGSNINEPAMRIKKKKKKQNYYQKCMLILSNKKDHSLSIYVIMRNKSKETRKY